MTLKASNTAKQYCYASKMASGRNLLCRPRQGGHGSHENKSSQKSFVLSREFLESRYQTPESLSLDLPRRSTLACKIPFHSGNRLGVWPGEYGRPSSVYNGISK